MSDGWWLLPVLLETSTFLACRKAERYFCTKCTVVQFIWMRALYIVAISKKNFHYFPRSWFSRRVWQSKTWCKLISNRVVSWALQIYIICREAIRRALNSKTQLEITGEMYQMPPRSCTCALFRLASCARYCFSKAAPLGRYRTPRCDACVYTFYITLTHETHNNK
jgi:hypothetical protein